jgi:hypothetical protein
MKKMTVMDRFPADEKRDSGWVDLVRVHTTMALDPLPAESAPCNILQRREY